MSTDNILNQLTEGTVLEGPHWTEPVKILTAKPRGSRIEVQAVGTHAKKLWTKLLKPEEFDGAIKITQAGTLAALDGDPTQFRLAAEAHRIRLAFQYDPHFAVSVSQVDPLPHQMDAVYTHVLTQPRIRFLIADDPGAGKTIMAGLSIEELKFQGHAGGGFPANAVTAARVGLSNIVKQGKPGWANNCDVSLKILSSLGCSVRSTRSTD